MSNISDRGSVVKNEYYPESDTSSVINPDEDVPVMYIDTQA